MDCRQWAALNVCLGCDQVRQRLKYFVVGFVRRAVDLALNL